MASFKPELFYVVATLLPLASFFLLLMMGGIRFFARAYRNTPLGRTIFEVLGGDTPRKIGAFIATGAMGLAFILSLAGMIAFGSEFGSQSGHHEGLTPGHAVQEHTPPSWDGSITWASLRFAGDQATRLTLGYHIDSLTAVMFLMVTFIATLIHIFSIGYMADELSPIVVDHQVHTETGHLARRGRFGRFFLFLSLFCFSMLNLVLADNLFQVFLSWELVGICSYLLIGFFFERRSAANAANKAFIVNRVGDAGFIIGLLIIWTYIGDFNFQRIFAQLPALVHNPSTHWLMVVAGLGIFLGCVGKSAQFPLHVWLPDAMEGPTPVSALIHAATMVAAGVYLVGRAYPLFTPEARIVIAYTGGITLFVAATIALVMTDIKKVLAYSTVSQLGYMMLGLGVGGWVAGLFHLLTHAFFKALLFLASGSVIHGCHHEQEMPKMGGLFHKMKITAITMLVGVLAIGGVPLFSGWYSKDQILAQALGYCTIYPRHFLLYLLPLVTAGLTAFYMFRLWFMTFLGTPRDEHIFEHAHESPRTMTVPLILLAICSIVVAWGWPMWQAEESFLGGHKGLLSQSEPTSALNLVGTLDAKVIREARYFHSLSETLAYLMGGFGILFAVLLYWIRILNPADAAAQFPAVHRFLFNKWYFDELYSVLLVRPALAVAIWCRSFDLGVIDRSIDSLAAGTIRLAKWGGSFDLHVIDGAANLIADIAYSCGRAFRRVQTGYLRNYVLFLVLAAVATYFVLSYFVSLATAGR
jgi:NADH-quinone oxidoreductase subunit L